MDCMCKSFSFMRLLWIEPKEKGNHILFFFFDNLLYIHQLSGLTKRLIPPSINGTPTNFEANKLFIFFIIHNNNNNPWILSISGKHWRFSLPNWIQISTIKFLKKFDNIILENIYYNHFLFIFLLLFSFFSKSSKKIFVYPL